MIKPSIRELMEKVDSRYSLVCVVSKRARQIVDGEKRLTEVDSNKPVTIAVWEVNDDKITYKRRSTTGSLDETEELDDSYERIEKDEEKEVDKEESEVTDEVSEESEVVENVEG